MSGAGRAMVGPVFIFDVGGVFVRHDNALLYDRLAACCSDPVAARPALEAGLAAPELGTGRLGVGGFHARLVSELGFAKPYDEFLSLWSSHFSEEPGMAALIRDLAARRRVVLFSNTNAAHWAHVTAHYPALGRAHACYLSHELGLVKPDPAAFRRVLELEAIGAADAVFVDDRADNVAAATALGMRGVVFPGADALALILARYLR